MFMRTKRFFLALSFVFFVLSAVPLFSQSADGWYYDKMIKKISYEGLKSVKASEMEGVTSSFIGKAFTDEVYEDLLNRTFALNFFENVTDIKIMPSGGDYETCKAIEIILVVE